ncbi:ATP-binding protein [Nocardiopsis sp. FIRDI 009]|uniref:ATP-binding protein n=1 Tax=Nocardiopsis sp. FIRDI 009 TaxID=714197 RepID=UPI0018E53AE9|nr:ATP-binding protein [Nocardiopsis sp. FIRDI 009]
MNTTVLAPPVRAVTWWDHRVYTANLAQVGLVRRDLAADLTGFDSDLVDTMQLCAAELAANAVKYAPDGSEFLRALAMPTPATLWLAIVDEGGGISLPRIPTDRTVEDWDMAEGQRGLALVDILTEEWGCYSVGPGGPELGIGVWTTFNVASDQAPDGLGRFVLTR